jgi:hypothetical protein
MTPLTEVAIVLTLMAVSIGVTVVLHFRETGYRKPKWNGGWK